MYNPTLFWVDGLMAIVTGGGTGKLVQYLPDHDAV